MPGRTPTEMMEIVHFLDESNKIESEFSVQALEDAIDAWTEFYKKVELKPENLTIENMLAAHAILLRNLDKEIAGKLRDCDVWIGMEHKIFVSKELLEAQITSWLKECDIAEALKLSIDERDALVQKWHVAFEDIHPFADGNGRIGRMLWQLQRMMLELPVAVIDHRLKYQDYYPWFQKPEPKQVSKKRVIRPKLEAKPKAKKPKK